MKIYTDGACSGNPGPGGYGTILKWGNETKEISGCDFDTTNNRMEMKAVIKALSQLERSCTVHVFTDSKYVVKGMTEWMAGWIKRGWLNSHKKPVLNRDLWEELLRLSDKHQIQWYWIRGHDGHPENERCDQMARDAIKNCLKAV